MEEIDLAQLVYSGLERQTDKGIASRRQSYAPYSGGGYTYTDVAMYWKDDDLTEKIISRFDNKTVLVMYTHCRDIQRAIGTDSNQWNPVIDGVFQQVRIIVVSKSNSGFDTIES